MQLNYKMIACDLDDTLLSTDCSICERNIRAIRAASELGTKFVIATGRGFVYVDSVLQTLGLFQKRNQYVISFNGGAITENYQNRILAVDPIPFQTAKRLYERGFHQYGLCMHVYTDKEIYVYKPTPSERAFLNHRIEFELLESDNINFLKDRMILKLLYMYEDYNYLYKICEEMHDDLVNCEVSYSSGRYIEFNNKGVDKGQGMLKLASLLGIKREETIAIGDNVNDVPMIRAAGLGVGVANAYEGIYKDCNIITQATNNEGAVAEVIEKYILNQ